MSQATTRLITTDQEFYSLEQEWNTLHTQAQGTVFQTFSWLRKWWDIYASPNIHLRVFTVWESEGLVGILPMFLEINNFGLFSFRRLRFLGTYEIYGEYTPLIHPQFESTAVPMMAAFCTSEIDRGTCDMITFFRFPSDSTSMELLLHQLGTNGFHIKRMPNSVTRVMMDLPDSWEKYVDSLSSTEQELLKRRSRSLEKNGADIEVVSTPSDHDFDDYVRLHTAAWFDKGIPGYFGSQRFETFQRTVTAEFMQNGMSRLYFLNKDGIRFAAVHAFFVNNQCCFYLSGLDKNHELARYSPGKVLLSRVIKDAINEHYKIFDFQGGTEEYKFRLGGKTTGFAKSVVWNKGMRAAKVVPVLAFQGVINYLVGGIWTSRILPEWRKLSQRFQLNNSHTAVQGEFLKQKKTSNILTVEEYTTLQELEELEPIWNDTLRKSNSPTLYLTYEWLTTWWRCHKSPEKNLFVLIIKENATVIGIAPFIIITRKFLGIQIRTISFLSMVKYAYSALNCSGSLDIIITHRHDDVMNALFSHLLRNSKRWDYLRLHPIPEDSRTLPGLSECATKHGYSLSQRSVFSNATLTVTTDWEHYFKNLSVRLRKELRNRHNRLSRLGTVTFQYHRSTENNRDLFQELLVIERKSWKGQRGVAIDSPKYKNFYSEIFHRADALGWLHLWVFKVNDNNIAYDFAVEFDGTVEILKGSYVKEFQEYSPGKILTIKEMEYFIKNGIKKINLLWGDLTYKLHWMNQLERHAEVYIFNDTLLGKLMHLVYIQTGLYRFIRLARNVTEKVFWNIGLQS